MSYRYPKRIITNDPLGDDFSEGFWNLTSHGQGVTDGNYAFKDNSTGVPIFLPDSNSADLFLALPLTNYNSTETGGFFNDVSPLIRSLYGQTPGSAKTATSTGNGSQSSAIASPFAQYTDNLLINQQTTTAHLIYYSIALNFNTATTVEFWNYIPTGTSATQFLATNGFGGGFYQGASIYRSTDAAYYFTNTGGTQQQGGGTLTRDQWNHVAYVFDGIGTNMKIFINGTQVFSSGYNVDNSGSLFAIFGSSWDGIPNNSGNRFQDLRIYTGLQKYTGTFTIDLDDPDLGGRILG